MGGPTLEQSEKQLVYKIIGCGAQDCKAITVCRIHFASGSTWEYKGDMGAVCVLDFYNSSYLVMVNLDTKKIQYQQELYSGMKYTKDAGFFHSFEGEDGIIGFNFADESEAGVFYNNVISNIPTGGKKGGGKKKKEKKKKKDKKGAAAQPEFVISGPTNVQHVSHIGYNAESGFELKNIPPEWKALFSKAGVTKEDFENKETAEFIMDFVNNSIGGSDETGGGGGGPAPPPPPPPGGGPPPPPPPGGRAAGGGGRAPPPPPAPGGAAQSSGGGGGGGDLLSQIRAGTALKKTDTDDSSAELSNMSEEKVDDLAGKLHQALISRRGNMEQFDDDEEEEEEDWM